MNLEDKIKEFINHYKSGQMIFLSVVKRHFKSDTNNVLTYLFNSNQIKEGKFYRCPKCLSSQVVRYDETDELVCENCDYINESYKFIEEQYFTKS